MNIPEVVLAAMTLCNQHAIATKGQSSGAWLYTTGQTIFCLNSPCKETSKTKKEAEDGQILYAFDSSFAWAPEYQEKCKKIHDYVDKVQAEIAKTASDKMAADESAAKAAEQPTLDKGIAALKAISK